MTTIPKFNHISIIAVVAVASLVTAACGGDEDSAVIETPSTTTAVESVPHEHEEQPCDTPQAEIQDDGYCYVDGQWYADAGAGYWVESDAPPVSTTVEQPVVEESPSETVDVVDESQEGYEEVEPEVICGEGLTLMEEFVTDTDNGCRTEICDDGRDHHGDCALPPADEPMSEEEVAELPTETIPQEEYGLEGCTEVSLGVCDKDGLLFCYDTIEGWNECPGQPSGDLCEHDDSDHLSLTGNSVTSASEPVVTIDPGIYRVDVCLSNNDLITGEPSEFMVYLPPVVNEDGIIIGGALLTLGDTSAVGGLLIDEVSVVSGEWSHEVEVIWVDETRQLPVLVTNVGGGSWSVSFSLID